MKTTALLSFASALILGIALESSAGAADVVIRNATIMTVTKGTIKGGDLLIQNGKIKAIGKGIKVPAGGKVIDGTGKFVMPGIIDAHSHLACDGGLNESTEPVAAECNVYDVINNTDSGIKWALAGGVTCINTMHGSANPIGGLVATLKMRWGKSAEELKFAGAKQQIKFALGENPRRVHAEKSVATRLGVADTLRQTFVDGQKYRKLWDDYNKAKAAGQNVVPPRKDLRLESIAGILRGDIWVQCHSYRADEIEMLLKLSDEFHFKVGAMQHVLEGYKVAQEMAARGIGASTFADFWGYKVEAYDGIIHNAAAMTRWGVRTSVNSDSGERIRRLNLDASKSQMYGGLTSDECLALITINPAWQLGIDKQTGSLEVGKDADISIWDGNPLSSYAKCVMTLVDGETYFERKADGTGQFGTTAPAASAESKPRETAKKPEPTAFTSYEIKTVAKPAGPADYAITGAHIVTVSGPVIENGTIVIRNGRIEAVGEDVSIPSGVKVIHANGQWVYPGFINATGTLGLTEIGSVSETQDITESGTVNPNLRALDAFHVQSAWVGLARCAGVTTALVSPRGSGWSGQIALMHTGGRTVEQSTVVDYLAQALSLSSGLGGPSTESLAPRNPIPTTASGPRVTNNRGTARGVLDQAKSYQPGGLRDLVLEAIAPVVKGEKPVVVNALFESDIEEAVKFGKENNIRVIVSGGQAAAEAAAILNPAGVPVIFTESHGMTGLSTAYDINFSGPKRMFDAGVKFCIANSEPTHLAQIAGQAAAFGLPKEEALKAITLYPAQILGVDKELGSIDVGKIADLMITDGDPLEYKTQIKKLFINGVDTPLVSRHSQLYDEFKKKK